MSGGSRLERMATLLHWSLFLQLAVWRTVSLLTAWSAGFFINTSAVSHSLAFFVPCTRKEKFSLHLVV